VQRGLSTSIPAHPFGSSAEDQPISRASVHIGGSVRGGYQHQTRRVATVRHGYEAGSQSMRQVNLGF
jgi:hypothetical protein